MFSFEFLTGSHLADGVILACAAFVLFTLVRREGRVRPNAPWVFEKIVYIVYAPLITVLNALAVVFVGYGLGNLSAQPPGIGQLAIAGAAMLLAAATWWLTRAGAVEHAPAARSVRIRPVTASAVAG